MIKFAKLQRGYSVYAREPAVRTEWHSLSPLTALEAIAALIERGADVLEIETALSEADPGWRTLTDNPVARALLSND